jgi:hypothetical protein
MRGMGPNLAARPFANERPVKRTTLIVWILALTLLAINIFVYQRHLSAHYDQRQAVRDLQEQIGAEERAIRQREADLAALELGQQNEKVVFLNGQIARRTFSWSHLFDRLEEVLPANVDLHRVSPRILKQRPRDRRLSEHDIDGLMAIEMGGDAQTVEEVLELVDRLFEHESFTLPNLMGERQRDDGRYDFSLTVLYLPAAAEQEGPGVATGTVEEAGSIPGSAGGDG